MSNIKQIVEHIEGKEREKSKREVIIKLKRLLDHYMDVPGRLEDCKYIISRCGLGSGVLTMIFNMDNLDLYLYVLEQYKLTPTEKDIKDIISKYLPNADNTEDRFVWGDKILDFILEKHPEACTDDIKNIIIGMDNILLFQKIRKLFPGFYPTLGNVFASLYLSYIRPPIFPTHHEEILEHLIAEGFRPEYYSANFDIFNPKSLKGENFIVEWDNLPNHQFSITNRHTQAKVIFLQNGEYITRVISTEGDSIEIFTWLGVNYENILQNIQAINTHGDTILTSPLFASLRDIPSLRNISKNLMGTNGVSVKGVPPNILY